MKRSQNYIYIAAIALVVVAIVVMIVVAFRKNPKQPTAQAGSCTSRQFSFGSSGTCVSDIQTMIDFMESGGFTQCPFTGGSKLAIDGAYDSTTQAQVKVVQTWMNCYNKQEGVASSLTVDGSVDVPTWTDLCNFSYEFPKNSSNNTSPYSSASITAGKDAGC